MKLILAVLIIIISLAYEKLRRPMVCKRKINAYISNLGGEIYYIEDLTPRDEIYCVYYTLNGDKKQINVKFNIFYKETWC